MTDPARSPAHSDRSTDRSQPLLHVEDAILLTPARVEIALWDVKGTSLVCLGEAASLVQACVAPELLESGRLELLGREPREALRSGDVGHCPSRLPGGEAFRVRDALGWSRRLISPERGGSTKSDVDEALDRVHAGQLGKKKLTELSRFQARLVGLAHGLLGRPQLLLLEDPFAELDDGESELVEAILDEALENRSFIAGLRSESPWTRRLASRAQQAVFVSGGRGMEPTAPSRVPGAGLWITTEGDVTALATALGERGHRVTLSPHPSVALVQGAAGLDVFDLAERTGTALVGVAPAGWGG